MSFTWQNGRQLASAANDTTSVAYTYNQNGIRTSKTVNGVKTTYILDENDQLMGEVTGNNTTVFLYDENGTAYGFLYNNTPYFYLFNGQGDVVNVVDETGVVVATYNYDAWGNVISSTGTMATINPIRYRGYYYDAETELYYLQSRYYDAVVGRFLNADDVAYLGASGTTLGYNLFAYCENSPIIYSDSKGYVSAYYALNTAYFRRTSRRSYSKAVSCLFGGFVYRISFTAVHGISGGRPYAKLLSFTIKVDQRTLRAYTFLRAQYYYGSSNIFLPQQESSRTYRTYQYVSAPSSWKMINTIEYEDFRSMVGVSVDVYFRRGTAQYHLFFIHTITECWFELKYLSPKKGWQLVEFNYNIF